MRRRGSLGSVEFSLALSVPKRERYQRRLIPVDPEGSDDYRLEDGLPATRKVARWKVDEWSAGEGNTKWKRGDSMYHKSAGARPVRFGDGVELGPPAGVVQYSGADLTEALVVGEAEGYVWVAHDDGYIYRVTDDTATTRTLHGGGAQAVISIAGPGDGYIYVSLADKSIRRVVDGGANAEVIAAATNTYIPLLTSWGGSLWMLDGNDLYEITSGAPGSRTLRADIPGAFSYLLTSSRQRRITESERGLVWLQNHDDGAVDIWEYNVYADSQVRLGRLPAGSRPTSIFYANGFVFVGMLAGRDTDGYVYYQRGAQRGAIGPFRRISPGNSAYPLIVGMDGEELLVAFDDSLWAYTPSTGGIVFVADMPGVAVETTTAMKDNWVYVSDTLLAKTSYVNLDEFVTSGTLDSGRHDFAYPGLVKILTDVTVETDPLPASTSVSVSVSADRGSFTALTGTHDVDGETSKVFTASAPGALISGREFEIRVTLAGTSSATPTVRAVTARATGGAWEEEWVMAIDCDTAKVGTGQDSATVIAALRGLAASGMVTFTNPFEVDQYSAPESVVVTVEDVILPDEESDEPAVATVRVRARDLTEVS